MRVLLALAVALTTFAVAWLIQDWINAILNQLPITFGEPDSVTQGIITLVALPFILLFNMLWLPGALVGGAPVLIALAVLCGLTSGGLWIYRRRQ